MNNKMIAALLVSGCLSTALAIAQDDSEVDVGSVNEDTQLGRDRSWSVGVGVGLEYDDNIYRSSSNEEDAFKVHIRPAFQWELPLGPFRYALNLQADIGLFDADTNDNDYFDQVLGGQIGWSPDIRHNFNLAGQFTTSHDPLGTIRTDGLVDEDADPDKWYSWSLDGKYLFGAPEARANLEFAGGYGQKKYTNNRNQTRFLDQDSFNFGGALYYRVGPATRAVVSADYDRVQYDDEVGGDNDRDRSTYRLRGGVTWLATAKTSGEVLGGYYWTRYDDSSRSNSEGFDWRINVNWLPRTYSTVTLTSGLSFEEGNSTATNTVETRDIGVSWEHQWQDRISSSLFADYINADHEGIDREDDIWQMGASVNYQLGRNYSLDGGYRYTNRDSNDDIYDFSRNVFFVDFNAEF